MRDTQITLGGTRPLAPVAQMQNLFATLRYYDILARVLAPLAGNDPGKITCPTVVVVVANATLR